MTLIDRAAEVVGKNELTDKVWPDVTVEEGCLPRLRCWATKNSVAGTSPTCRPRGYSLVGLSRAGKEQTISGRDDVIQQMCNRLTSKQLTTILGNGGIGKTTLASGVGLVASTDFAGAVFFVPPPTQLYKGYLGNVRAALDWSFNPCASDALAIRLAAAWPLAIQAALAECRDWMERQSIECP
ncbi:hypothetical protein HFO89_33680 [Rhizobium leguminosarum]|uniref:hypothetical protein n=1 Tax=Rhizobium leguminosarum TaxID=384 RepID=UPI001C9732DB|nr:hypothetical protein [Rhizobium leguminosarum]MBY5461216.1 hypothetical protein [Rhizobium leguminosarum]